MPGPPQAGCGRRRVRVIRWNAEKSAGVSENADSEQHLGVFRARYETGFTKTHIKPRLLQKEVLLEHRM